MRVVSGLVEGCDAVDVTPRLTFKIKLLISSDSQTHIFAIVEQILHFFQVNLERGHP